MAKKKTSSSSHGAAVRAFWQPGGRVDAAHAEALRVWIDANADGVRIPTFIYHEAYRRKHARIIREVIKHSAQAKP
jgi:hypothetical protein